MGIIPFRGDIDGWFISKIAPVVTLFCGASNTQFSFVILYLLFFLFFTTCLWCYPLQGWNPFFFFQNCFMCHFLLGMLPTHFLFSYNFLKPNCLGCHPLQGWHPRFFVFFFVTKMALGGTPLRRYCQYVNLYHNHSHQDQI